MQIPTAGSRVHSEEPQVLAVGWCAGDNVKGMKIKVKVGREVACAGGWRGWE